MASSRKERSPLKSRLQHLRWYHMPEVKPLGHQLLVSSGLGWGVVGTERQPGKEASKREERLGKGRRSQ
jgi:hypothetical protein